jgi:cytochrome c553
LRCNAGRIETAKQKIRQNMNRRRQHTENKEKARRGRAIAKLVALQLTSQALMFASIFVTAGRAEDASDSVVSKKELQAKMDYCNTCHGPSGQGFRAFNPIPRLAGQPIQYLKNQLKAFSAHGRSSNIMYNVSHVLSPAMLTALTTNFNEFNPKPLGGAPKELVPDGKKIFEEGIPGANTPPCTSCHGPQAKGNDDFPRLAGQLHDYIFNKLTNWSRERGQNPNAPDTSTIMEPIAHSLTAAQIKAVAAYVSYLE